MIHLPSILVPRRRLLAPCRTPWRPTRWRTPRRHRSPSELALKLLSGNLQKNSAGNLIKDSLGALVSGGLCYRARKCSDNSLSMFWLRSSQVPSFPYYFKRAADGLCYSVACADCGGGGTSPGAITAVASCTDASCPSGGGTGCTPVLNPSQVTFSSTVSGVSLQGGCDCYTDCPPGVLPFIWDLSPIPATAINGTFTLAVGGGYGCYTGSGSAFQTWQFTSWSGTINAASFATCPGTPCTGPTDGLVSHELTVYGAGGVADPCSWGYEIVLYTSFSGGSTKGWYFQSTLGTGATFANTIPGIGCSKINCLGGSWNAVGSGGSVVVT